MTEHASTKKLTTLVVTCVELHFDPHQKTLADVEHERHHRPAAVVEMQVHSEAELAAYRPGAVYRVTIEAL